MVDGGSGKQGKAHQEKGPISLESSLTGLRNFVLASGMTPASISHIYHISPHSHRLLEITMAWSDSAPAVSLKIWSGYSRLWQDFALSTSRLYDGIVASRKSYEGIVDSNGSDCVVV